MSRFEMSLSVGADLLPVSTFLSLGHVSIDSIRSNKSDFVTQNKQTNTFLFKFHPPRKYLFGPSTSSHQILWSQKYTPRGTVVKNPPANAGDTRDTGSIPGSGRSPGIRNGNPLRYPCLENPMDREAWRATVHRITTNQT